MLARRIAVKMNRIDPPRKKSCCLCRVDLDKCKGKTRHKRLFGESCTQEKQKLEECIRENFSGAKNFDKDSVICYECLQKLGKMIKYEKEIQDLEKEIVKFLNKQGMNQKRLCTPQAFSRAKKHKAAAHNSTSSSTSTINDVFTVDGMFTVMVVCTIYDIFTVTGTSTITSAPDDSTTVDVASVFTTTDASICNDTFTVTDTLTLDHVSTVTHTSTTYKANTVDDTYTVTGTSTFDDSSTVDDTSVGNNSDNAAPTVSSPSVSVRHTHAHTQAHNYIPICMNFVSICQFCR